MSVKNRKIMITMMEIIKRPMNITVYGPINLNLEQFATVSFIKDNIFYFLFNGEFFQQICNLTYSFFTLMQNVS